MSPGVQWSLALVRLNELKIERFTRDNSVWFSRLLITANAEEYCDMIPLCLIY